MLPIDTYGLSQNHFLSYLAGFKSISVHPSDIDMMITAPEAEYN